MNVRRLVRITLIVFSVVVPATGVFAGEWQLFVGASKFYWNSGLSEPHTDVAPAVSLVYAWREALHVKVEAARADGDFTGFRAPNQQFTANMLSLVVAPRHKFNERFAGVVTLGASHMSNSGEFLRDQTGLAAGLGVEVALSQQFFFSVEGRAMFWGNDSGANYENPRMFFVAGLGARLK